MSRKAIQIAALTAAATVLAVVPTTAGHAAQSFTEGPDTGGSFQLSISDSGLEKFSRATLTCDPTGGSHPRATEACDQLVAHSGDIGRIASVSTMCAMDYRPVTVRAKGTWRGQEESFEQRFGNRCLALQQTGGVIFNF